MPLDLHIATSPLGRDDNPGSLTSPLATLEAARDRLRAARHEGKLPDDGATVTLHAGTYSRDKAFVLTEEDSGTALGPIVYRAAEGAAGGAAVRLIGGCCLPSTAFTPVTDPTVLGRLAPDARGHVLQADLRAQGIAEVGSLASRGFSRKTTPAHLELFFADQPMTVAQWPNAGEFATISGYPKPKLDEWGQETGELSGGFKYDGERPKGWAPSDDIWVHGYWSWDWANSYERVLKLSPAEGIVETADPFGLYSFRKGQRFYFLNVLEELDQPGEYYVDVSTRTLYFWPPAVDGLIDESIVSVLADPLVSMENVSHMEFRNLTLEGGRGYGIQAIGGTALLIAGCVLRNLGTWAVSVDGGSRHTVAGCDIYGTGDGGIEVKGGDRETLAPCGHEVTNNHIHHFARWSRCYVAGINANGVGMRIANNLIHDAPHNAILFSGNEFSIENNEIYRVCLETGDAGAIYTGRDYTFRGNAIRRNFIHHMGGMGMGSIAIYMDDCISGTHIAENVLQNCMYGIMLGGGRDSLIENNVFVNCRPAVHADGRGMHPSPVWQNMVNKTMRDSLEAMRYHEPPYSERYPEILGVDSHYAVGTGVPPEHNYLERNICFGGTWLDDAWPPGITKIELKDNFVTPSAGHEADTDATSESAGSLRAPDPAFTDPAFSDPDFGVFSLRADSPAWAIGFKPIPLDEIGLVRDAYRSQLPPHVRAALSVLPPAEAAARAVGQAAAPRLLLRLRNDGATEARGTAALEGAHIAAAVGAEAVRAEATRVAFCLQPGETRAYELAAAAPAAQPAGPKAGDPAVQVVQVSSPDSWMHPAKLELRLGS